MARSASALALVVAFTLVGFGWRTVVQVRRHGDTGWRFDRTGPDRVVGPLLVLAFLLLGAAPVAALVAGSPSSPGGVDMPAALAWLGALVVVGASALTVAAQLQMGASWRIGVREGERTDLVTGGLFARVRNPIFTGMLGVAVGTALLVPNALALAGLVAAAVTLEVQVRVVEEPHLRAVHGAAYERWAAGAGRFVPGLGRLARR